MQGEQSIAIEREMNAILFSLAELKPFFENKNVTDIWVDNGNVSIKEFGKSRHDADLTLTNQQCKNILVQIAKHMDIDINYDNYPVLEGTIPHYDARITGVLNPWTKAPFITIRKRPQIVYSLEDYIKNGQLSEEKADKIMNYIKFRKNILISGGTNSGKTTLTNAIIKKMAEYAPNDSFFIVEDNAELQCKARYAEMLTIKTEQAMSAIKLSLRSSPDRIIFGEIRDGEVLWALLDAFNTGHPGGCSTIHANSAEGTFLRMKMLLKKSFGVELPVNNLIDMIIHCTKDPLTGMKVDEVIETRDYTESQIEEIAKNSIEMEI